MNYNSFSLDGKMSRNDINLRLNKDLAEINLHGLFLGSDSQFVDYHTTINHVSPNCNSNEIFQGVMNENSKGVFNGLVNVSQYAKNTNSNQNLIISSKFKGISPYTSKSQIIEEVDRMIVFYSTFLNINFFGH